MTESARSSRRSATIETETFARDQGQPLVTVQQHILQDQKRFPGASGEFSLVLSGITLATKMIQAKVRRAGLADLGPHGEINVQGEVQQKLDVYANEVLLHCLSRPAEHRHPGLGRESNIR